MSEVQYALLFPFFPVLGIIIVFVLWDLASPNDDDDDDRGKGLMQPAYQQVPVSNPA